MTSLKKSLQLQILCVSFGFARLINYRNLSLYRPSGARLASLLSNPGWSPGLSMFRSYGASNSYPQDYLVLLRVKVYTTNPFASYAPLRD